MGFPGINNTEKPQKFSRPKHFHDKLGRLKALVVKYCSASRLVVSVEGVSCRELLVPTFGSATKFLGLQLLRNWLCQSRIAELNLITRYFVNPLLRLFLKVIYLKFLHFFSSLCQILHTSFTPAIGAKQSS
jgi:hypothetical protein